MKPDPSETDTRYGIPHLGFGHTGKGQGSPGFGPGLPYPGRSARGVQACRPAHCRDRPRLSARRGHRTKAGDPPPRPAPRP